MSKFKFLTILCVLKENICDGHLVVMLQKLQNI